MCGVNSISLTCAYPAVNMVNMYNVPVKTELPVTLKTSNTTVAGAKMCLDAIKSYLCNNIGNRK